MSEYLITKIARTVVHHQRIIRFNAAEKQADGTYLDVGRFTAPHGTRFIALANYIAEEHKV